MATDTSHRGILLDHQWRERREPHLTLESGEAVVHRHCERCGRDVVTVLASGKRYAAYASALFFRRLNNEVTIRWLSEECPGERPLSDEQDRKRGVSTAQTAHSIAHSLVHSA